MSFPTYPVITYPKRKKNIPISLPSLSLRLAFLPFTPTDAKGMLFLDLPFLLGKASLRSLSNYTRPYTWTRHVNFNTYIYISSHMHPSATFYIRWRLIQDILKQQNMLYFYKFEDKRMKHNSKLVMRLQTNIWIIYQLKNKLMVM